MRFFQSAVKVIVIILLFSSFSGSQLRVFAQVHGNVADCIGEEVEKCDEPSLEDLMKKNLVRRQIVK
ncbi:hypothetical protein ACI2OX_13075 [Bacillus sp. N9]